MPNTSRPTVQARDASVISGIIKRLKNVPSIVLAGVTYTPTSLVALFQSHIDAANAVDANKGQWKAAVQAFRTLTLTINNALTGLREFVRQMFNNAPDALADFGFAPKKVAKKSPVTKIVAAEKNRATRAARHTVGPKKKLATKGTVTAAEVGASVAEAVGSQLPAGGGGTPPPVASGPEPAPVAPASVTASHAAAVSAGNGVAPQTPPSPGTGSGQHTS